jgi:hypothetical protein
MDDRPLSEIFKDLPESFERLENRIKRLELLSRLFIAPILPYSGCISHEKVRDHLAILVARDKPKNDWDDGGRWTARYSNEFEHTQLGLKISLDWNSKPGEILDAILSIAAIEERTPRSILMEIDPDVFPSAVDALAASAEDPCDGVSE